MYGKMIIWFVSPSLPSQAGESRSKTQHLQLKNGNAVLLPEAELNTETLLSKMNEAIDKNTECPYQCTQEEMLERIKRHAATIYQMASEQLQKDMLCYVNGDMRLNIEELSDNEIRILNDIEENMGLF